MAISTAILIGAFLSVAPAAATDTNLRPTIRLAQAEAGDIAFWQSVKDSADADELEAYLSAFPNGKFVPLARLRLQKLRKPDRQQSAPRGQAANSHGAVAPASMSAIGAYQAAEAALSQDDYTEASRFLQQALRADPANPKLLPKALTVEAILGRWQAAGPLAKQLLRLQPNHRLANLISGVEAYRAGKFGTAGRNFAAGSSGPIGRLTASLALAWVHAARKKTKRAFGELAKLGDLAWAAPFTGYQRALIADYAGRRKTASAAYAKVFKTNKKALRVALAYARHEASRGRKQQARKIIAAYNKAAGAPNPLLTTLAADIAGGRRVARLLRNANDGLAEALWSIGSALIDEGARRVGLVYVQLARHLKPDFASADVKLAETFSAMRRHELALTSYRRVAVDSPFWKHALIRQAHALNAAGRPADAFALLRKYTQSNPGDTVASYELANIYRANHRYDEAVAAYSRAIEQLSGPRARDWKIYYGRGVSYERLGNWAKARADFERALALDADQAILLNYYGFLLVDKGTDVERGFQLVRKATRLKPKDGYFVDSLGWAHFKSGDYQGAVRHLERANELRPDDAVITDHLGDAYWRLGRHNQARLSWRRAIALAPSDEMRKTLEAKLANGLSSAAGASTPAANTGVGTGQRSDKRR